MNIADCMAGPLTHCREGRASALPSHGRRGGVSAPPSLNRPQARRQRRHLPGTALRAQQTQQEAYRAPSSSTGASELELLARWSTIVPDTLLLQDISALEEPQAATVSSAVLRGILSIPAGNQYKAAVENARSYDRCAALEGDARASCQINKATVNVGQLFSERVKGRVSTEVDPRLSEDKAGMVRHGRELLRLYGEMGVAPDRVLVRLPGTWAGIQAAKELEADGIATHVVLVYSLVQAQAAAQAGVSVIQPNIGRLSDWYHKHPGFIKDPKGPREDTGFRSGVDPGVALAARIAQLCRRCYATTRVMVSGIRRPQDAMALAGVDYLVLGGRVLDALSAAPTAEGYNDGLRGSVASPDDWAPPLLAPSSVASAAFDQDDLAPVSEAAFQEGLGLVGQDLLRAGVSGLVADLERLQPFFQSLSIGSE